MKVFLLTDIPVWVRPLQQALAERDVEVTVGNDVALASGADIIVNRLSARLRQINSQQLSAIRTALQQWDSEDRQVINGWHCFELGLSKLKQYKMFQACEVDTPATKAAIPGSRAIPGTTVLLKPPAGGFGKGIQTLGPDDPAPVEIDPDSGWIEQEQIKSIDGMVHRIEVVGNRILYDATTPLIQNEFDYCLANTGDTTALTAPSELDPVIAHQVIKIPQQGGLKLGSIECFLTAGNRPCFFDFNPVSSLHPGASEHLGEDPIDTITNSICQS